MHKRNHKDENENLLTVLDENSRDHQVMRTHCLGIMNVCPQFHGDPSSSGGLTDLHCHL